MSPASVSFTAWLAIGLSAAWAQEAPQPRMNARELFYNTAAGSPAAKSSAAKPKPAEVAKAAAPARKKSAPPPAQLATAQPAPPAAVPVQATPPASAPNTAPEGQIVRVATFRQPSGWRCRRTGAGPEVHRDETDRRQDGRRFRQDRISRRRPDSFQRGAQRPRLPVYRHPGIERHLAPGVSVS